MKKIAILLLISGITSPIFAQLTSSNISIGLKGGLNLSNYDYKLETKSMKVDANMIKSFNVSGYANIPISPFLSIQSGVSVNGKGSNVEIKTVKPSLSGEISGNNKVPGMGDVIIDANTIQTIEDNFLAIEVPLNLVAFLKTGPGHFFIGAGPYVAYHISGTRTVKMGGSTSSKEMNKKADLKFGKESTDNLLPLDYGVNALAGYQLKSGINFGAGYGFGFVDLVPKGSSTLKREIKNRVISFSVGYAF